MRNLRLGETVACNPGGTGILALMYALGFDLPEGA